MEYKEKVRAALDAHDVTDWEKDVVELLCDDCDDMPDTCPCGCGRPIDWSAFAQEAGYRAFGPADFPPLVYAPCAVR